MKIQCPACNAEYEVEESCIGQKVECECGHKWKARPTEIIKAKLYKRWIRDYSWIKVCPVCKKRYFANYKEDKNKYLQCSCGQYVKIDEPEKHPLWDCLYCLNMFAILALMIGVFIGIPAFLIAWGISSCSSTSSVNSHEKLPHKSTFSRESGKIDAWVFTQYLVEQYLKSPKSAKFPFGGAQNHVEETVPGIYIIRSYVDAKNAFGAEIRQHFFCKLQRKSDGKFEVLQLTFQ